MNFVELDIGGLTFITEEDVTPEVIASFLEAHMPSNVYTDIRANNYQVSCMIIEEEYRTSVYWRVSNSKLFNQKDRL